MKYLNSRDNYLKSINERRNIENNNRIEESINKLILENEAGSGALGNEVKWGDSLLGRFLHNIIRKAQDTANLKRISFVVTRLRDAMDTLLVSENLNELNETDSAELNKAVISEYLDVLEQAIVNFPTATKGDVYYTLESIKDLTNDTIGKLEGTTSLPYLGTGFKNKNEILRQLKQWKQFLDGIEFEEQAPAPPQKSAINAYRKNFLILLKLLLESQRLNGFIGKQMQQTATSGTASNSATASSTTSGTASSGDIVSNTVNLRPGQGTREKAKKTAKDNLQKSGINNPTPEQIKSEADKILKDWVQGQLAKVKANASYSFGSGISDLIFEAAPGASASVAPSNGKVFSNVKNLWGLLSKVLGKEELSDGAREYINIVDSDGEYTGNNLASFDKIDAQVKKIYDDIRKKSGIAVVYESMVDILNDHSKIASGIKSIYDSVKDKDGVVEDDDLGLSVKLSNASELNPSKKLLKEFNDTFVECLNTDLKESRLFKYSKFISLINEATKFTDRKALGAEMSNWWNNKLDFKKYILTKQQAEVLKESLEKKLASKKDYIVIEGMDPVLEIVKCFNRAYKIHTKQVIPSGRSDGQVTNKIFMEYTCFGSGTPKNAGESGGPYRQNKLFDSWESNVLDILKDKQYQKIFNVKTRLKVGDEYIDKAGSNLRKFMTDMLNGDEFYGKGDGKEGGLQAKFLDKYFGYKDGDDAKNTHFGEESERQNNQNNTPDPIQVALEPAKGKPIKYDSYKSLIGTFFALTVEENSNTIKYYFYIQDYRNDYFYLSFCQSSLYLKEYLMAGNTGRSVKLDDSSGINVTHEKDTNQNPYLIRATKIKSSVLYDGEGRFTSSISGTIKCSWLEREDPASTGRSDLPKDINHKKYGLKEESLSWSIKGIYHVIDKATNDRVSVKRLEQVKTVVSKYGGYDDVANIKEISNVNIG